MLSAYRPPETAGGDVEAFEKPWWALKEGVLDELEEMLAEVMPPAPAKMDAAQTGDVVKEGESIVTPSTRIDVK